MQIQALLHENAEERESSGKGVRGQLRPRVFKSEATTNLLSPKGIEMRINRSSQVEGVFGVMKQNMNYDRVRRKGLDNVSMECMLVCLGYNIRKLFTFIEGKGKTDYWTAPDGLEPEIPKEPNMERLIKKLSKKKNGGKTNNLSLNKDLK